MELTKEHLQGMADATTLLERDAIAERDKLRNALAELALYFTSGNEVPVERATIRAADFWRITGMTPNT